MTELQSGVSGSPRISSCGYPLKLEPIFQERVWGQQDLEFLYPQRPKEPHRVGEVWLTGDHNRIANGPLARATLAEVARACGPALLGTPIRAATVRERAQAIGAPPLFPLLVKFLFTSEKLSVQVHPPDAYARHRENSAGKTEMWHVLRAEPGAQLAIGFRRDLPPNLTKERSVLKSSVESGEIEHMLDWMEVQVGETFFVPAGTVHAIGPGLVICEIQQNSDITYRLYDYNRPGTDGRPRPLHVEKALDVLAGSSRGGRTRPLALAAEPVPRFLLAACPYFATERLVLESISTHETQGRAEIWIGLEGAANLEDGGEPVPCRKGEAVVIPADLSSFSLRPDPPSIFLRSYSPLPQTDLRADLLAAGAAAEDLGLVCFPETSEPPDSSDFVEHQQ